MAQTGLPYLVEESLGKKWYFFLSDQQRIQYACNENGVWTEETPIDGQLVKTFSVTIDRNDKIYLLAYTLTKQLIYYEWDGSQWYQRLLYRITSRFENISRLLVLSTLSHIHLFYYIESSLKRAQESFVHAILEEGRWKSDVIMNFLTDQTVMPEMICSDYKGNLHCVYTKALRNRTQCYFIKYDNEHKIWTKPTLLFQRSGKCSGFNGFADPSNVLHMVWTEEIKEKYYLNYRRIDTEVLSFSGTHVCIREATTPMLYPCIHSGNGYHCFWNQDGRSMASYADKTGLHWDKARDISDKELFPYIRIYKTLDSRTHTVLELGDGYPGFKWSTSYSIVEGQKSFESPDVDAKSNNKSNKEEQGSKQLDYQEEPSILEDIRLLSEKIEKASSRMDDFYTALYQLQEYIRQKDKSFYQMDAQIRKLSFEIDQLRTSRTSNRIKVSSYTENEDTKETSENDDTGTEKIQLGNVSILVNPEEEAE